MNANLERRLARLKNYRTRYELAIRHPDGRCYLVSYSDRKSRDAIFHSVAAESRATRLIELTGDPQIRFGKRVADGATMGEWTVNFTGRTQRECFLGDGGPELDYIGDREVSNG